ncbi:MAG: hypothetical protein HOB26_06550 [Flavobacteriales bacterium]|jgi:hypothetical protein|nr:hypothetical protein [Flavobacteriales bacterium]MBT6746196.1 hypothetical protein [Flavobacteriales bacterium]
MDASDLIYIAIVLIGLISGFLKNRKKETTPNKKSTGNLEDLLKEFVNPDTKKPTPNAHETSYIPVIEKPEPTYTDSARKSAPPDSKNLEPSEKSTAQIIKERKAYFKQKNEFPQEFQESDFNLKEAIIHNTILNRPEY